jgi:glycosyltransferase involved in cell wall biosynthesis
MSLVAIILTLNEAQHIGDCIESLRWADSILVFDSFSTDDTVNIAKAAGVLVIQHAFVNYTAQRNAALEAVSDEWVYFVDADERSSPAQAEEIRRRISEPTLSAIAGYWVPRHNHIAGKLTLGAGWYPDYQLRLLRRANARYDPSREVHEVVLLDGPEGHLETPLVHYNYRTIQQFYEKQRRYTDYAARELYRQGVRVKPQNYVLQPLRHFIWRFVTLKGYRDGWHGLRLSLLMARYELQKYLRLKRLWRRGSE